MTDLSVLSSTHEPWVLQSSASVDDLVLRIGNCTPDEKHVVIIEGTAMGSASNFYNELRKKLKFPEYFGGNLNALDECMTDLDWLNGKPLVIIIREAEAMLLDDSELLEGFIDVMRNAGEEWSTALNEGNEWDRPAIPFHVVLNYSTSEAFASGAFPHLKLS